MSEITLAEGQIKDTLYGLVTSVSALLDCDRRDAQVTYSPVWLEGPDGEQMRASRPDTSFVIPVDWLEVVE